MIHGKKCIVGILAVASLMVAGAAPSSPGQGTLVINTSISGLALTFDWPAIEVGIGSYEQGPTGLTIIRFPHRASLVVDSRGGAPGTVNTDALRLGYGSAFTDAVVFSGGSSYGEEPITAVATGLKDEGVRSGDFRNVAFVPGAIIYDFGGRRLNEIYSDKRLAQAVLETLRPGVFPLGAQGAGRMAMQGGFFGCNAHSGQGGAFRQVGQVKIAAFVVVNASGAITDRDGRLMRCNRPAAWGDLTRTADLLRSLPAKPDSNLIPPAAAQTANTTISLIVTNQKMDYAGLQRLAIQVHTSMARAIQPFSTEDDGDTLYAASTQEVNDNALRPSVLATIEGEVMWDAVLASVPEEPTFAPPATPPSVSADTLASYAGTYEFGTASVAAAAAFSGIGLSIDIEDGLPKIAGPTKDGPAARAGLVAGDVVTQVDGTSVDGLSLNKVLAAMRGPAGSTVVLTVQRSSGLVTIPVVREPIRLRALLSVQVKDGHLVVEAIGGSQVFEFQPAKPRSVTPLSENEFFVVGRYHTRIAFTRDTAGQVSGAVLNPGRWEQTGAKTK